MESERIWLLYTAEKQERRKNLTKSTPPLRTIIAMESERIWLLYTAEKQERGKNLRKSTPPLRTIIVIVSIVILVLVCASLLASVSVHSLPFATVDAEGISGSQPAKVHNLVQGKWIGSSTWNTIVDPLNGEPFIKIAEVDETGTQPFVESLSQCPKHGLRNPFKSPERYLLYGDITAKAAHMLSVPKVSDFFTRLIQRAAPKSYQQALGEVQVTQKFLENFSGDQVS
ncbi:delta-1-pyrroline-5-carboxylate dehydrogenase 12A1, mitochondrial [Populus trichocarpa]|nr:delta-1-pyrroline-5-carboxylate dehydrogenase 12A1, mitochondrial [Populus trichocarpa]|eukprot:XP_024460487.1 delta-1-pyrroline-5-carboxylate dehydrogenase 12A1, mitochondrial [Populus trichocarpa]